MYSVIIPYIRWVVVANNHQDSSVARSHADGEDGVKASISE